MLGKTLRIAALLVILACSGLTAQAATLLNSLVWEDGVLILGFDGPYESRSMVLDDPDRIVLDFPDVRSTLDVQDYAGSGDLQAIRVGQNEPDEPGGLKARIVLDLSAPHNFLTEESGRFLRITLAPSGQMPASPSAGAVIASAPKAAPKAAPADEDELPVVAESETLHAPRPVAAASMGAMDALPDEAPAAKAKATKPDLDGEDRAPFDWEQADKAKAASAPAASGDAASEFARLSGGGSASSAGAAVSAAKNAAAKLEQRQAEAEAVFYGDPFETPEAASSTSEVESAPRSVAVVKAQAPVAKTQSQAAPVGKPVVMAAATGGAVGMAAASETAAQPSAPSSSGAPVKTAPVVKFDRGTQQTAAEAAPMQVADASAAIAKREPVQVAQAAPAAQPKAAPAAKTSASLMAGHGAVKPDDAPITLEMRGAEFRTVLRAFSEFANVNIVAGQEVKSKVSVTLDDVPWREALAAVCSANGYAVREEHGVLRVAPRGSLLQEDMEMLTAEKKRQEYRPLETRVINLSYAVAEEMTEPLSKMLTERGKMDVDERTNSLLITDLPETVAQVAELAMRLDQLMPQVEITARIVDLDYRASRDLGIDWNALNVVNPDAGIVGNASVSQTFPEPAGQVQVASVRSWGELNVTLQALEQENKANIISTPRVTTMDNREANILVGKKIPLIVADEAGNAITQLTTIGIKMVVTPHINPDGKIMMQVLTEVSDLASEATVQGGVIITTSESKTNVMVDNGSTAVIAGLIKSSESTLENGVPFLGKLPILGRLFGYSNNTDSKRELIIFITPRIVQPGNSDTEADLRDQGYTLPLGG